MINSCSDSLSRSPDTLSLRQQQILDFICDGLSSKQMADCLGLSIKTIEMHRSRLHKRLGTRNAQQVMRRASLPAGRPTGANRRQPDGLC